MSHGRGSIPATALAACTLGLVASPLPYVVVGAFSAEFSLAVIPLLIPWSGILLWRLLSKPAKQAASPMVRFVEVVGWVALLTTLYYLSGIRLMRGVERVGLASVFLLVASALFLPAVAFRRTVLVQRLARLPKSVTLVALILVLIFTGLAATAYLVTPPRFVDAGTANSGISSIV